MESGDGGIEPPGTGDNNNDDGDGKDNQCGPSTKETCIDPDNGLCIPGLGCSGYSGSDIEEFRKNIARLSYYWSPYISPLVDVADFGGATYEHWSGFKIKNAGKIGFGVDGFIQLLKDSQRTDLTYDQMLERAGISAVEGWTISEISATVAANASMAVLDPSLSIAVETGQLWIPPVAIASTWVITYGVTNVTLSYLSNKMNEKIMPGGY